MHPPPRWSMRSRYASYWNAFLFFWITFTLTRFCLNIFMCVNLLLTRLHSSRMRNGRGSVHLGGVSVLGGCLLFRGCLIWGCICSCVGVSATGGGRLVGWASFPACRKYYLGTTLLWPVKINISEKRLPAT